MSAEKQISVIVPIYNVCAYLEPCVSSILGQSYGDLEVLLVDDGSTDGSSELCDRITEGDSRVRVIHKKNGGLSDARNAGIEQATGAYLAFVDGDDRIAPTMLATLYEAAETEHCEIAVCNMVRLGEDGTQELFYAPVRSQSVWRGEKRFRTLDQPSVCNKLFRRELFDQVRFPVGKYYEDTYVYHVLLLQASAVCLTGQDGYYYLDRAGSILDQGRVYNRRYFDLIEAISLRAEALDEAGVHRYADEAYLHLYSRLAAAYAHIRADTPELRACFAQAEKAYRTAYPRMIRDPHYSIKQKLRLFLLRHAPALHRTIYG